MNVLHSVDEACGQFTHPLVAVGNFDGVHLGHRTIIEAAVARAEALQCACVIVTFEPHPQLVIGRQPSLSILTPLKEKLRLLSTYPITATLVIPFTREFSSTEPEAYVQQVYVECLQIRELVVGYSHVFGRFGKGGPDLLQSMGERLGFQVRVIPRLKIEGQTVSSSRIRTLLSRGHFADAVNLLGHTYTLTGQVVHGMERGRQLQFPTANIEMNSPSEMPLKYGVYAVYVEIEDRQWPGVMNIGIRPTFGEERELCEIHIIDFEGDLYHRELRASVVDRIRDEQRFPSVDALRAQISADVVQARQMLEPGKIS